MKKDKNRFMNSVCSFVEGVGVMSMALFLGILGNIDTIIRVLSYFGVVSHG